MSGPGLAFSLSRQLVLEVGGVDCPAFWGPGFPEPSLLAPKVPSH